MTTSQLLSPAPAAAEPAAPGAGAIGLRTWLAVLALAFALRAGWGAWVPVVPVSDGHAYDVFAQNLATHGVYGWTPAAPTAFWPVGTSFLYSLLFRAFGHGYGPIVVLNVALGVAVVALTMLLATRWFGPTAGALAGALVAAWPSQVQFTTVLASELPFMVLVLAAAWVSLRDGAAGPGRAVLTGVLLAAASYVRPTALLLPALFGAVLAVRTRRLAPLAWAALAVVTMAACIAPWTVRNARLFHRVVLVSTNGGTNAWMGNNPHTSGEFMPPPYPAGMNEAESNEHLGREARAYILGHPIRFAARSALKLVRLHERESIGVTWNSKGLEPLGPRAVLALKLVANAYWWAAFAMAIAGIVLVARREGLRASAHPTVAVWAYFAVVHAVTVIQDRYHFPAIPFMAALVGAVAAAIVARARRGVAHRREPQTVSSP